MTGETLYLEDEPEQDYWDPHYLHTAAELYEMQTGEVEYEYGHNFDPFGEQHALQLSLHDYIAKG